MHLSNDPQESWLDRKIWGNFQLDWEKALFALIILAAIASRVYLLGERVMSHDENSHVYYSWKLYKGQGFSHDPLMHGPFQFHVVALSYFLFGDSDFTARIPAIVFNIATIAFAWRYRRFLGRAGALAAATMFLISPYILYYGRYVRNEAFVAFYGVVMLWAILSYLQDGRNRYLYWLTTIFVLHFTTKETAFIYAAQALLFLAFYLIYRLGQNPWKNQNKRNIFLLAIMAAIGFLALAAIALVLGGQAASLPSGAISPQPVEMSPYPPATEQPAVLPLVFAGLALAALGVSLFALFSGYTLERLRQERSFDLLMLLGTLVLPQLTAFPIRLAGWNIPTNASQVLALTTLDILRIGLVLTPIFIVSILLGLWWNRREWLINAGIFYALFTVFQTTIFTNGAGFFTGVIGSLGYWLEQQGVNRGSQPWYYYGLIQVPVYEYLPALGTILAFVFMALGVDRLYDPYCKAFRGPVGKSPDNQAGGVESPDAHASAPSDLLAEAESGSAPSEQVAHPEKAPVIALISFWAVTSLIAFSIAGEKMPWLTVHITLPMILTAAWAIGYLIDTTDWSEFIRRRGVLALLLMPVFFSSLGEALSSALGTQPPFQGKELLQLQATSTFLAAALFMVLSGWGLISLAHGWRPRQLRRVFSLFLFGVLGVLTARTAIQSSYINYDNANELLVYAHSARGVKTAMEQIEEISLRTTDGLAIQVAFDNETSYPYWWYLRNYPNQRYYGAEPTRSLREVPVILVGDANFGKIEPVVGQAYQRFDYIRLWWPNQDYFDLTWERIFDALVDPKMRSALFQIWLNRDYTKYGQATGKDMSLPNWNPAARMRLYIRKDIVAKLWNYGAAASLEPVQADPYEGKQVNLSADLVFGGVDSAVQFNRPRGLAVAPDGTLYIADTDNHRIVHLNLQGETLTAWGSYADVAVGQAPGGTFNQPWGIAVAPDGSVYVADTWNHRVQKFSPEGEYLLSWGYFGQAERPEAFWGPRGVAVDANGNVYITDTGNKRVVVFDANGVFLTQFGSVGMSPGQFDEPVGIAVGRDGKVFVADTWNQRIQVFIREQPFNYIPALQWEVVAWFGQSLDNKPSIDVDEEGNVFITDPEGYRVLEFSGQGEFLRFWGDYGIGLDTFGILGGIALDGQNGVWVCDTGNSRVMRFLLPGLQP